MVSSTNQILTSEEIRYEQFCLMTHVPLIHYLNKLAGSTKYKNVLGLASSSTPFFQKNYFLHVPPNICLQDFVCQMLITNIRHLGAISGLIIDGYPRSLQQLNDYSQFVSTDFECLHYLAFFCWLIVLIQWPLWIGSTTYFL